MLRIVSVVYADETHETLEILMRYTSPDGKQETVWAQVTVAELQNVD